MSERQPAYDPNPVVTAGKHVNNAYQQSINELYGLPQTTNVPEEQLAPNMPNIFTVPRGNEAPTIWKQHPDAAPLHFIATKADVGGVGGHVETSAKVQAAGLDFVLRYNRTKDGYPIFRSLIATHTGDDLAFSGVVDERILENPEILHELMWNALDHAGDVAADQGCYGPKQDLLATAFTGNIHGAGPASIDLPLPRRDDPAKASQSVLLAFGDKTEPGLFNYVTTGAYYDPNFNTGLILAESAMADGYIFDIVDLDTKEQAIESGVSPTKKTALDKKMTEIAAAGERFIRLSAPEDYYDIAGLTMQGSRYVVEKIWSKDENGEPDQLGLVVSAERLHNIETAKGHSYVGKDDPVLAALCQGDWPAPGEITSPYARIPLVAGDCRGSHLLHLFPMPINEQTSFWSGPIISVLTLSINLHTGKIGAISDQMARGTPWDKFRDDAAERMQQHRAAHGYKQPGTLPANELEYQPGLRKMMTRLNGSFQIRKPS
ncbi:hypothetical protein A2911_00440 [Candidatus Nomurabacteria bacterium RIFCSPLOWO2_01_FULL_40_15]|uniref:Fructose-1,6-bisphosphate aldolase/phosphatase n=1 Tax=Candidatus Nomurabacteria bacterium RIFCSPLOWO2_01_FULL_40_15 TaxID=1801772 RepID=A0A1F6X7M3_9BACT|nr:MAG: hypothetical protein A2911_00440 [Candidatus Nomurabacteria bacterium RIFCSPLOWO2_01_FULL_40_15]